MRKKNNVTKKEINKIAKKVNVDKILGTAIDKMVNNA